MLRTLCFIVGVSAAAAQVPHEAPKMPEGWRAVNDVVSPGQAVTVHLALKQQNLDELYRVAYAVSDPSGPDYGQHLSSAQLNDLTAPSVADLAQVEEWLAAAGVPSTRLAGEETIEASFTAATAGALLGCSFSFVVNDATGQRALRAGDYRLPNAIHDAVSAVYGMHGLPLPPRASTVAGPDSQAEKITPAVIAETYKVTGVKPSGSSQTTQAVAEFQDQQIKISDLTTFFKKFVPDAPVSDRAVSKFVGKNPKGTSGVEAMLDIEYIMGVSPGMKTEFWYWGNDDFCKDLKNWSSHILQAKNAPLVHSVSYGWQGNLAEVGCTNKIVANIDVNLAKLAAKGITIIFASGDGGSAYDPSSADKIQLYASWPASSPWVTAVGSTRFVNNKAQPEMATDSFGSGGGFSSMFPAFKDQQAAVKQYLSIAKNLPPATAFNASGRATPDVSGLGDGYQVVTDGSTESVGGTSASTPMFASLVSLLNEARRKAGKPAMGYLNPFLYQNPGVFTDVLVGTNAIDRQGEKLKYGYTCAKGWDAATGLGTPDFTKMLAAAVPSDSTIVV